MRVLIGLKVGLGLLGEVPDGVSVDVWDGGGSPPRGGADVAMWVPPFGPLALPEALAALPDLAVVQLLTAGYEHVVETVPERVTLCNAGHVHDGAVAEWAVAVVLAMQRALPTFLHGQADGTARQFESGTLVGARVVLLGYGGIGQAIARRLEGFEADVVPVASRARAREGVHGVSELAELLPTAQVVVLAVPLTDATRGLVDAAFLARLPDDALVVNAARGAVVDQDALAAELASGRLRAALDVATPDPLPADHPLRGLPNVLYTPHVAGATDTIWARLFGLVGDQIRRLAAGEPLENVVSRPAAI